MEGCDKLPLSSVVSTAVWQLCCGMSTCGNMFMVHLVGMQMIDDSQITNSNPIQVTKH